MFKLSNQILYNPTISILIKSLTWINFTNSEQANQIIYELCNQKFLLYFGI